MRRYRQVLAVVAVILFFSGIDLYFFTADYVTVTPRDWVTLFVLLLSPLAVDQLYRHHPFEKPLGRIALWCLAYMAVSVIWYAFSPSDAAVQELRDRMLTAIVLIATAFVFMTPESRRAAGIAAIVVVLATVVINAIEMVQPDWFFMQVSTRSSGLYGNANQCGAALVIGMTIGWLLIPRRWRMLFCLLVGVGVAVTFSRSTTVGWLIASAIMLAYDLSKARPREIVMGGLAAAVLLFVLIQGTLASGLLDGFTLDDNLFDRVSFFKTFQASDDAAQERREVASKAWEMFAEKPLLGAGLASTVQWSERSSTHNMFLYFMADHGLLGALILPAMVICVFLGRPKAAPASHWAFCVFTMWLAFFSHNIFTERQHLLAFALFTMGGVAQMQAVRDRVLQTSRSPAQRTGEALPSIVAVQ
jgi:hypothetical protein